MIILTLYGKKQKQENITVLMTTALNQLFFDQREKVLIGKHLAFCGEVCVVDKKHSNRSKDWHKVGTS